MPDPDTKPNVSLRAFFTLVVVLLAAVALTGARPVKEASSLREKGAKEARSTDKQGVGRDASQVLRLWRQGRKIFRHDTLGSERFFTDGLELHRAVETVSPATALAVGLKVDVERLPREIRRALAMGEVDLDDPAVTVLLLQLDAVVGLSAEVDSGRIETLGITCALCHSTVDDSFAPGIGERLDGWANRDLDVGTILSLAPNLAALADLVGVDVETTRVVLASWGPGRFDAHLNLDRKAFRPDGESGSVLIPPAFGLAGVHLHTYTGWGSVPYWNAFVGNLEMGGQGRFYDPRLDDPVKFPNASARGFGDVASDPDRITSKLPALHFYQLSLEPPRPPRGSFRLPAARRGEELFGGKANCASCHVPPLYTEPGFNLHTPEEIGIDSFQSDRSPLEGYRTTPLRGLWSHSRGGFYHDGRFATLEEVVGHYDSHFDLELSGGEIADIVEFLKSL